MSIGEIYNFIQIDDFTATSGQPSASQFHDVRDAGYELVINLAPDGLDSSLPDQRSLLESLGIEYCHIPVAWTEPNLDQLTEFMQVMSANSGRRIWIHCQANYRVTAFFSLYAMAKLNWDIEAAEALVSQIWASNPNYQMDDNWKSFISLARQQHAQEDAANPEP